MGGSTRTVGGGGARPLAQDWNSYLGGVLGASPQQAPSAPGMFGMRFTGQQGTTPQEQVNMQNSLYGQAIRGSLEGSIGDTAGLNQHLGAIGQLNQATQNGPLQTQQVNPQNVQGVNGSSGLSAPTINVPGSIDIAGILQGILSGSNNPGYQSTALNGNDPNVQAIQEIVNRNNQRQVGDMRERFGMQNTSSGTGAMTAEAMLRAEANPQIIAALGEFQRQMEGLNQGAYGLNLQNVGQNLQGLTQAGQLSAGVQGQNAANQLATSELQQQQFGMILNDLIQRAGLNANIQAGNADRSLQAGGMNANNQLQAQQLFQNLLGQNAQFGLASSGMALDQANAQNAQVQNMIQMLMSAFQQSNALGTPQAQTVQQPGMLSQIIGGATGLLGAAAPFMGPGGIGALLGGGGNNVALPNVMNTAPALSSIQLPALPYRVGG